MRLFIAVTLPEAVQAGIREFAEPLERACSRSGVSARWMAAGHLHLTLKFLGECDEARLPEFTAALDAAARAMPPFHAALGTLGAFPEHGAPKVIWLGLREGRDPLIGLARSIEDLFEPLGFLRETRGFQPHLTLARVKSCRNPRAARALLEQSPPLPEDARWPVDSLALMRSQLSSIGPTYTRLHTSAL